MMNLLEPVASTHLPVPRKTCVPEPPGNWVLATETGLLRFSPLLWNVPQAAAFDQAVEIFGKIRGVVPGTLQSLRHQQHFEARRVALRAVFGEMFLKHRMTYAVDVLIHLQNLSRAL